MMDQRREIQRGKVRDRRLLDGLEVGVDDNEATERTRRFGVLHERANLEFELVLAPDVIGVTEGDELGRGRQHPVVPRRRHALIGLGKESYALLELAGDFGGGINGPIVDHDALGDRIRLGGEGEAGREGGPPGDLYVEINVRTHQIFQREGSDLHCDIPISFATAVLGGSVEVPTLGGQIELKVPSETQSSRVFRLRGKGVKPVRGGPVGDLLVHVAVETPVRLNREQQKLVKQFDESMQGSSISHSPREHGWLHGVKSFFERLG